MAFVAGDAENILKVLGLPLSTYTLDRVNSCMDTLETLSTASVTEVQALIVEYNAAEDKQSDLNMAGEGKTLVKADVLEWEKDMNGDASYSPQKEMARIRVQMDRYFSPRLGPLSGNQYQTSLIRS